MKKLLIFLVCLIFSLQSQAQNDCPPTFVCAPFSNTPSGAGSGGQFGEINAGTDGCLSGEHNSTWITVTILTSGTFQFIINPNVNANDFDFAVWGPSSSCPPVGAPIRCNFAANTGNTGLNGTATGTSEGVFGPKWCQEMNVTIGQTYLILVDNFTTNNGFNMSFGGTSTLDCTILPIELVNFYGYEYDKANKVHWTTASEVNNDYFTLEKSDDGIQWVDLTKISGAGNSSHNIQYEYTDTKPHIFYTYYRLKQTDFDGKYEYSDIIYVENSSTVFYTYTHSPSDGYIYFSGEFYYELYNSMGQIIISGEGSNIKTDNLSLGIYILKIGSYTQKILI